MKQCSSPNREMQVRTTMRNLKYDTNELVYKTETDSQTQRAALWSPRGRGGGGGLDWESGMSRCKLVYIGWISNKVLLCSTGNSIQYPVVNHNGKEKKPTMRYYCTPTRMAKNKKKKKKDTTRCWWGCRATDLLIQKSYTHLHILQSRNSISRCVYQ